MKGFFSKRGRKFNVKKVICPQCNNDSKQKKNCLVCRGQGYVWMGK